MRDTMVLFSAPKKRSNPHGVKKSSPSLDISPPLKALQYKS